MSEIDRRYARALFGLVAGSDRMLEAERALAAVARAVDAHEPLRRVLDSPVFSHQTKASVLGALTDALGAPDEVGFFGRLVAMKGRAGRLRGIASMYERLVADHRGRSRVDVFTARPIPQDRQSSLMEKIAKVCGKEVEIDMHLDPALVGGVKLRMGSRVVDASIRGRIDRLAQHLHGN